MALDLRVSGPGLDVHRRLQPGAPALVLGRDADCDVRLPDPGRNVSRRHLGVWNEADRLHFHVLSLVAGVDTSAGPLPPGARGVLAPGEALGVGAYRLSIAAAAAGEADPWAEFEREAAQLLPDSGTQTLPSGLESDDPFSEWGFQSTFGPGVPADAPQPATDLQPFLRGLGLAAGQPFTEGELETLGRVARIAVQALLQAADQEASDEAFRSAIEDIARAFDPEGLRQRLRGGDLFESARAWDAFARDYAERYPQGDEWVGAMIDRHFAPAYALALMRAKRNTKGRDGG
jgi:predicted component of type VI protein secretion system